MPKRTANATWTGDLKGGKGRMSTQSGTLKDTPYSFTTRFENEPGTNPEELVAAALASCYSMALANNLASNNLKPTSVETTATATFEKTEAGFTVTGIHLDTVGKVPGATPDVFQKWVEETKKGCPISRLLSPGTKITVTAKLG